MLRTWWFFLFLQYFLIYEVTFIERFLIDLIFLAKFFNWKPVNAFEMNIHNWGTVFSIVFCCHSFFIFQLNCLPIHPIHFFIVAYPSIFITELIQIIFNFDFCRCLFVFAIGLIHFRDDFNFLFDSLDGLFTIQAPGLRSDVLNESILARLAFLGILRCNVDCVHLYGMQRIIILKQTFYK